MEWTVDDVVRWLAHIGMPERPALSEGTWISESIGRFQAKNSRQAACADPEGEFVQLNS